MLRLFMPKDTPTEISGRVDSGGNFVITANGVEIMMLASIPGAFCTFAISDNDADKLTGFQFVEKNGVRAVKTFSNN